jgi:hypothetical protein
MIRAICDSSGAALAHNLENRCPEDTSGYLPALHALFALNRHEPQKAELLRVAAPYDLAVPAIDFNAFFGGLYPVYTSGRRTWRHTKAPQPPRNSRRFLTMGRLWSAILSARWRASD